MNGEIAKLLGKDLDNVILGGYRGSIAHGTYVPSSDPNSIDDKDLMFVCVPDLSHYFGLKEFNSRGTKEIKHGEWDIVLYEVRKFVNLLMKGNPNVLMMLWLEPNLYVQVNDSGKLLIDNRGLFVGRHVYRSFTGYAYGQLKKMTAYKFEGWMGTKRKTLVDKYGFDSKCASHLIRILKMGIEFMRDGQMYVQRHDAQQLLDIKHGKWGLTQVKEEAERLFKVAEEVYLECKLPVGLDLDKINDLCVEIVKNELDSRLEL